MSRLVKISLTQFRNYSYKSFDFPSRIACITGANGCGKTNLLDAVYYLCYTKSYFTTLQQHTVQSGTDGLRVEGVFKEADREEIIVCKWKGGKKEISANGYIYEKLNDHIGRYAAVMIAPDDMELINDGSELRRRWMDSILCQVDRQYFDYLIHFQKVLLQRNGWLKLEAVQPSGSSHALEFYNQQLVESGTYIFNRRRNFIEEFIGLLNQYYHLLSSGKEQVVMHYTSDLFERPLLNLLTDGLQQDLRLQRTSKGIHKDDLQFALDDKSLKNYGSQGQKKSYLFALKLAQYQYLSRQLNHLPILLLDDVFEKLDQNRMEALIRIIEGPDFGQVILTDTHAGRVEEAFSGVEIIHRIAL